jgi:hypothetical protein
VNKQSTTVTMSLDDFEDLQAGNNLLPKILTDLGTCAQNIDYNEKEIFIDQVKLTKFIIKYLHSDDDDMDEYKVIYSLGKRR